MSAPRPSHIEIVMGAARRVERGVWFRPALLLRYCDLRRTQIRTCIKHLVRAGRLEAQGIGGERMYRLPSTAALAARDAALIAEAVAAGRVTRCPPAYLLPTQGATRIIASRGSAPDEPRFNAFPRT